MSEKQSYTCSVCGETFDKGWSDEEAEAELTSTFPGQDKSECEIVCDDCYQEIMKQNFG